MRLVSIETHYFAPFLLVMVVHYHHGEFCSRITMPIIVKG